MAEEAALAESEAAPPPGEGEPAVSDGPAQAEYAYLVTPPADEPVDYPAVAIRDFTPDELTRHLKSEPGILRFIVQVAAGDVSCEGAGEPCILVTDFAFNVQGAYNRCLNLDPASLRLSAGFREEEHGVILTALEDAFMLITSHVERVGDMGAFATDPDLREAVLEAKRILDGIQDHLR